MTTQPLAPQDLDLSQFDGAKLAKLIADLTIIANGGTNVWRGVDTIARDALLTIEHSRTLLAEVIRLRAEVARCADDARRLDALDQWREPITGHTVIGGECEEVLLGYWFGVRGRCETVREAIDAQLAAHHPSTAASEAAGAGE